MSQINLPKIIEKSLCHRELFTKSLFSRPESLSALMPYDGFIEEDYIFQLKDGSLGAIFEVNLLEHEPMTEKQILKAVSSVKGWFLLPENCVLQVLHESSPYSVFDKKICDLQGQYKEAHHTSKFLFSEKMKELNRRCKAQGKKEGSGSPLKRRTLLSIRYFPRK